MVFIKGVQEVMEGDFNFGGVGDFAFNGRARHVDVIISRLSGRWAREGSL